MSFEWALVWTNWTFGPRWMLRDKFRYVVLEVGPLYLCVEW